MIGTPRLPRGYSFKFRAPGLYLLGSNSRAALNGWVLLDGDEGGTASPVDGRQPQEARFSGFRLTAHTHTRVAFARVCYKDFIILIALSTKEITLQVWRIKRICHLPSISRLHCFDQLMRVASCLDCRTVQLKRSYLLHDLSYTGGRGLTVWKEKTGRCL